MKVDVLALVAALVWLGGAVRGGDRPVKVVPSWEQGSPILAPVRRYFSL